MVVLKKQGMASIPKRSDTGLLSQSPANFILPSRRDAGEDSGQDITQTSKRPRLPRPRHAIGGMLSRLQAGVKQNGARSSPFQNVMCEFAANAKG